HPGLDPARGPAAPPAPAPLAVDRDRRHTGRRQWPAAARPARAGPDRHARGLRRPAAPPARRRAVAAAALAAPASARLGAADAWRCGVRHPARRRLVLVLRRLGAARAAVAALGAAAGAAPRALCRLARRRAPGRGARGLVVAPLALRRDRQAAGAA